MLLSKYRLCLLLDEVACRTKQEVVAMEIVATKKDMDTCTHRQMILELLNSGLCFCMNASQTKIKYKQYDNMFGLRVKIYIFSLSK